VELGEGQSFVIAGLLDNREEKLSKLPVLSSIPILGSLFKSKDENKQRYGIAGDCTLKSRYLSVRMIPSQTSTSPRISW
jgi:hypothetical protein